MSGFFNGPDQRTLVSDLDILTLAEMVGDFVPESPAIAGDYDGDGALDDDDFEVFQQEFGEPTQLGITADGNGDGVVTRPTTPCGETRSRRGGRGDP